MATKEQKPETTLDGIPAHLCRLRREVSDLEREHEDDKATAAASKKALETKQREFFAAFDEHLNPRTLFDEAEAEWRDVPLADAVGSAPGVTAKVLEALAEAELKTVGQLADFTAADGGRQKLTDLKGIGRVKAEAVEAALEKFWERRNVFEAKAAGGEENEE